MLAYFVYSRTRSPRLSNTYNSSNCDRKVQSYPAEYYLESAEEYSEGKIHMSEPESGKGNVKTALLIGPGELLKSVKCVYDE